VPRRGQAIAVAQTRLASCRAAAGRTQTELAAAIGLSIATYRRLEQGLMPNPPLRYLTNAAMALEVPLDDLIEDDWRRWYEIDPRAANRPRW
jgi:transcriptional regulator with XRE-family HTH domain